MGDTNDHHVTTGHNIGKWSAKCKIIGFGAIQLNGYLLMMSSMTLMEEAIGLDWPETGKTVGWYDVVM